MGGALPGFVTLTFTMTCRDYCPSLHQWCKPKTIKEVKIQNFQQWRATVPKEKIVHIKGFGEGMGTMYDNEITTLLKDFDVLVWDGDDFSATGFTQWVPKFLASRADTKVAAFRLTSEMEDFHTEWDRVLAPYHGRCVVIPVNLEAPAFVDAERFNVKGELQRAKGLPDWASEYFLLGRVGIKVTGSSHVLAMGGGGISAIEADMSKDEVTWTVFAASRGKQEEFPSLVDYAASTACDNVLLVSGKDPHEQLCFHSRTKPI